jgi:signal transduction histidine kinase
MRQRGRSEQPIKGRRANRPKARKASIAAPSIADLQKQVGALTRELKEALEQQIATAEVLQVINSSPGNLAPVFDAILEEAHRLCAVGYGALLLYDGEKFRAVAVHGLFEALAEWLRQGYVPGPNHPSQRLLEGERFAQVSDWAEIDDRTARATLDAGIRTTLFIPLRREGKLLGYIGASRPDVRPFTEKEIALLESFAAQAVIAIENVRLFEAEQQRTKELAKSLEDLRAAQNRLIQSEKLASLGQLTAGIAHEIKNPLNFINNFAALSTELIDELQDVLKPIGIDERVREDVEELTKTLRANLSKVVQHGKRADSIVKNMLLHSREGSGELRTVDVNVLVDESLNLAYHGVRAEKPQFTVTLQRDFDPAAGMVEVFPQEITRVLLNLISNGFYAVTKRKADNGGRDFEPLVSATTRGRADHVEIRIRDNGTGIPPEVKEKMFIPFFTTKPAGEGTGLGLSISHDIVVKHGGAIAVETEPGVFAEFIITLPRGAATSGPTAE